MSSISVQPISVSDLTLRIKRHLHANFSTICVQGEISNLKLHTSGHLYFSIKDADAQLNCVLFKGQRTKLSTLPKQGDQVTLYGEIDVYLPRGSYQLIVKKLELSGLGALLLQFEKMKKELQSLGYFDAERKKPLPQFPQRIGIVTSPTGAAIQDILNVLKRRVKNFHVLIAPVHVQGTVAAQEIADAIDQFNQLQCVDVILVTRGGGSIEDLWAFNEKKVADAIFNSTIPVLSGVGHEVDFTISDFTADVRAPTPSAAAELVCPETAGLEQFIATCNKRLIQTLQLITSKYTNKLKAITEQPFFTQPDHLLYSFTRRLDDAADSFTQRSTSYFTSKKHALSLIEQKLSNVQPKAKIQILQQRSAAYLLQFQEKKLFLLQKKKERLDKLNQIRSIQLHNLKKRTLQQSQRLDKVYSALIQRLKELLHQRSSKLKELYDHIRDVSPHTLLDKGYALVFSKNPRSLILGVDEMHKNQSVTIQMKGGLATANIEDIEKYEQPR